VPESVGIGRALYLSVNQRPPVKKTGLPLKLTGGKLKFSNDGKRQMWYDVTVRAYAWAVTLLWASQIRRDGV